MVWHEALAVSTLRREEQRPAGTVLTVPQATQRPEGLGHTRTRRKEKGQVMLTPYKTMNAWQMLRMDWFSFWTLAEGLMQRKEKQTR